MAQELHFVKFEIQLKSYKQVKIIGCLNEK